MKIGKMSSMVFTLRIAGLLSSVQSGQAVSFTFTRIDYPGSVGTVAVDINNAGTILGTYDTANFQRGVFLETDGLFTVLPFPANYFPKSFNDVEQIVGNIEGAGQKGFLYSDGVFTLIDFPGSYQTQALAINSSGVVFGNYEDTAGLGHPFLYKAGVFASLDLPPGGYNNAASAGINDAGQVAGTYADTKIHGFVYTNGMITTIDVPDTKLTAIYSINNSGQLIGRTANDNFRTFFYSNGEFTDFGQPFDPPGIGDIALGLNDSGQIVGTFPNRTSRVSGYLAVPVVPEPGSLVLFILGLGALPAFRRKRNASSLPKGSVAIAKSAGLVG